MASPNTTTITAQCYCKSIHYTLTLLASGLPLGAHICHCSTCRYTHGTIHVTQARLPQGIHPQFVAPSSLERSLTRYAFDGAKSERHFCSTCGCHVGDYQKSRDTWAVATALFSRDERQAAFAVGKHIFTESAPGGLHELLPGIGDRVFDVYNPAGDRAQPRAIEPEVGPGGDERLRAECHCGGVSFTLPRPSEDLFRDEFLKENWLLPAEEGKWFAVFDACNDCRLISGVHVQSWAFVPLMVLEPKIGRDLKLGTMKTFPSSPGVVHTFCGVCGATVFYWSEGRYDSDYNDVVDIAIGILRAPEGLMAERWLKWGKRIHWLDVGSEYDDEFCKSLNEGYKKRTS